MYLSFCIGIQLSGFSFEKKKFELNKQYMYNNYIHANNNVQIIIKYLS